ncbi:YggS family pyridoxal phosphate-dependent enzyme [Paracoccus aerodenitrificans]|uniref:YggS family pyridoxal phosphate-dependent enzyme n=1 Tax=Paracoccus aerodenitrificans TaxID=3017781 RepID=UPI0022F0A487|nr:YggS family pyridoxal phosphate-dependent enzyme [Paracoccus aerodenitrificans]WBU64042.1 YggS family pyridoxal phosphate-dependent enzyme [Paracoccus aerodenitrificans]
MSLDDIRTRMANAEKASGRSEGSVELIAVSKVQPDARVLSVLDQGHRIFGENYVQEAQGKWPGWRERYPDLKLHMIGPLQSNKAKAAVGLFDAIHTLDRMSLARKLATAIEAQGTAPDLFVQVNTGDEPQKAGILPDELAGFLEQLHALGLQPKGLMCIPPESEEARPHFRLLRKLAEAEGLTQLSMGMSADFEEAIAEGATHIRVGSAIFGARDYSDKG